MPELPEVETVVRGLREEVVGRVIESAEVLYAKAAGGDGEAFVSRVAGRTIEGVRRRGKLILLDLSDGMHLAVHLKMTGRLFAPQGAFTPDKHTHVVFRLAGGRTLYFRDVRKFGWCLALTGDELGCLPFLRSLGPEPLNISREAFVALFSGRRARIKALLLDQRVIAGLGNIYADEALFRAGIHPAARADEVSQKALAGLSRHVQEVLAEAIAANGSTFSDYVDARGDAGAFQKNFAVYGRSGLPCPKCGAALEKTTVAGRSTVFCPSCQRP